MCFWDFFTLRVWFVWVTFQICPPCPCFLTRGCPLCHQELKKLMDTDGSLVITRGREGKRGVSGDGRRRDLGWRTHNTMYTQRMIDSHTWNLCNFTSRCHPSKFNTKEKMLRKCFSLCLLSFPLGCLYPSHMFWCRGVSWSYKKMATRNCVTSSEGVVFTCCADWNA